MRVSEKLSYSCFSCAYVHRCEHYDKCCDVGKVVGPADDIGGERVVGLCDWLTHNQRAEPWEDFEQRHLRYADAAQSPGVGVNEWEAEDVVGDRTDQAGERA